MAALPETGLNQVTLNRKECQMERFEVADQASSVEDEVEIEFLLDDSDAVPHLRGPAWIVAEFSTDHKVLPMNSVALVGLAGQPEDLTAIIRLPSGDIVSARAGDKIDAGEVLAVLEDNVLIKSSQGFVSLYSQPDAT